MLRSRLTGLATAAAVIGGMLIGAPVVHAEGPDTTPPTVTIISPVENQQVPIGVQPLPTVQYTCDDDVAVQTCDASIGRVNGSNPWITVGNTMPLDLVLPGQYILRVTSTDTAGNPAESSVQFEMVGEGPRDETAPSIQITAPVDGAPVTKGANLTATYLCQDSGSGIESCDGPVASGAAVDTSTLGRKDFTVVARDKAGNESMQTVQYEVIAPTNVTVAGTIKDIEGNVLPGSTVRALMTGTSTVVASTEANANGVYSLTLPAGTYDLRYRSHSGTLLGADLAERTYLQDKTVNVVLGPIDPDPVVLSGTITTGSGSPLQYAYIALGNASTSTDAQGRYSLQVQPGSYSMQAQSNGVRLQKSVSIGGDGSTLNLQFPQQSVSVLVHVVDADGQPVTGPPMVPGADRQKSFLSYDCTTSPVDADGSGELWTVLQTVYGVADTPMAILADSHCAGFVRLPDYSRDIPDQFDTTNANLEYTVSATPPADTRIVLSGAVTDEKGDPLQYAYLTVGNTYASTDAQGRYSLRVEPGTYSIQAQFNGVYLQRPITIADTTTLDLRFPARPASVLVHVVDSDGQPVTGPPMVPGAERQKSFLTYNCATAPMDADGSGQPWTVTQAVYGIADTAMSVIGDAHCAGSIRLPDYSRDIPHEFDTTAEPLEYTVLATPPVDHRRVVSGVISDASGDPLQYAYITMGIASGLTDAEGRYSLQVEPGYHVVQAQFNGVYVQRPITMGDTAMQLDLRFPDRSASVLVHMVDADGQPVTGPPMVPGADRQKSFLNYYCQSMPVEADGSGQPWTVTQYASGIADTPMTIINDAHCAGSIRLPDYSRDISHEFNTTDQPLEYTVFRWGASIPGGDNDTNDGDNVADMVEALAPTTATATTTARRTTSSRTSPHCR